MNAAYALDWLNLIARWAHVIAGISWIGASFYFVWLDDSLTPPANPDDVRRGVFGELWAVHGGGFYHNRKFLTGPRGEPLTENLHWFKWEAYSTWITGMAMLAIVYWAGASTFLIDKSVLDLTPPAAIAISIGEPGRRLARVRRCCAASSAARPALLWTAICAASAVRRLGAVPRLRRTRGLHPRRLDRRNDHGRERLLRHHPRPAGDARADSRRPTARSAARTARQDALGPQHVLHAAGAVHHDQQPLPDDVRLGRTAGSCSRSSARPACSCGGSSCSPTSTASIVGLPRRRRSCCWRWPRSSIAPHVPTRRDGRSVGVRGSRADRRRALRGLPRGARRPSPGSPRRRPACCSTRPAHVKTNAQRVYDRPSRATRCRWVTSRT